MVKKYILSYYCVYGWLQNTRTIKSADSSMGIPGLKFQLYLLAVSVETKKTGQIN